jgi:magnesium-transporting ATPase (P-type)
LLVNAGAHRLTRFLSASNNGSLNTIIGIVQEGSAEKAADALKAMLSSEAVVVRDGKEVKIPAEQLVPGDLVKINQGDRVPADVRMLQVSNLSTLEAMLTGEPVPIEKIADAIVVAEGSDPMLTPLGDRHNMCFSATLVSSGSGTGLVVTTGDHTEIGTINALVNKVEKKKTNVLEQIDKIATVLAICIVVAAIATWFAAYYAAGQSPIDAVSSALVCAVAMIPEGLEAIVTMVRLPDIPLLRLSRFFWVADANLPPLSSQRRTPGRLAIWPRRTRSFELCRRWKRWAA